MFKFPRQVVCRDGYKFTAKLENWEYIFQTDNKEEISILEKYGFLKQKKEVEKEKIKVKKSIKPNKVKNESNK